MIRTLFRAGLVAALAVLTGCAAAPLRHVDESAFRESKPASILVLPPLNESLEPAASAAVLAQATYPLAESGYYVVPVALMDETFRENGMISPDDAHQVSPAKLREIFGADAALYLRVKQYGSSYQLLESVTTVAVDASLVDLRTGAQLWEGSKTVAQASNGGQGSMLSLLLQAVVDQVANTLTDRAYDVAALTNQQLLMAGTEGGLPYGPRSPHYELK